VSSQVSGWLTRQLLQGVKLELRVSRRFIGSDRSEFFQSDDANSDRIHAVRLVELLKIVGIATGQRRLQRGNGVRGGASDIPSVWKLLMTISVVILIGVEKWSKETIFQHRFNRSFYFFGNDH
jgi:hypothetical protein